MSGAANGDGKGTVKTETLIFDQGSRGRRGVDLPPLDIPARPLDELLPAGLIRDEVEGFPEVSEPEVVRHFTRLSQLNFSIDTGMYPLGSCTMKYNPRLNEEIARYPEFALLHPHTPVQDAQGALEVMWELEELLKEICGMDAFTLAPAAGAHGELTGLMVIRAALLKRGERREKVLIPDSAHGTNPASAVFCGFKPQEVRSGAEGILEPECIREHMDGDVAALMLTNPNTLGLFEKNIVEIARIVHERGGFVYCDGANLNALLGVARPGDMGIDVLQSNLHKTFSTPHGGGGPGAGPVGVKEALVPFLPVPRVVKNGASGFDVVEDCPDSIGRIRSFAGNFGVILRGYAYIRSLGAEGLRRVAETAVLNANYVLASLKDAYHVEYPGRCMHECVLNDKNQRRRGVATIDIAKRLADYGFHAPTVYFPLIVSHAMMIEPTETETKDSIDGFIEAMLAIAREVETAPELLKSAPHSTPVRRLDETRANRKPDLRWRL